MRSLSDVRDRSSVRRFQNHLPFTIPGTTTVASVQFDTWFEIEGVDPEGGFDLMIVSVRDVGTGTQTQITTLNPVVATPEQGTHVPMTSGGYNAPPVFRPVSVSMVDFIGRPIQLVFEFRTEDHQDNGFRGWIVDDLRVTNEPPLLGAPAAPAVETSPPVRTRRP